MEMGESEPTVTWTSVVPEFYYDLISKIPPGVFLFLGLLYEVHMRACGTSLMVYKDVNAGVVGLFTVLLIAGGYSLGIFISAPERYLAMRYTYRTMRQFVLSQQEIFKEAKKYPPFDSFDFSNPAGMSRDSLRSLYRTMHDFLKLTDPIAKATLPKMISESVLCNNSAIALGVYGLIHAAANSFVDVRAHWHLYVMGLIGCIVLWRFAWLKFQRAIETHVFYLKLYIKDCRDKDAREGSPVSQNG
jgi:hypothetical protein